MIVHQPIKDSFLNVGMRPFYRVWKSSVTKRVCVRRGGGCCGAGIRPGKPGFLLAGAQ